MRGLLAITVLGLLFLRAVALVCFADEIVFSSFYSRGVEDLFLSLMLNSVYFKTCAHQVYASFHCFNVVFSLKASEVVTPAGVSAYI